MRDAGCDARRAERGAWHLVMHADPDPADLLAVRECAAKVVELVRSEAYLEKNGSFDSDSRDAEDRAEEKDGLSSSAKDGTSSSPSYSGGWAMDQTLRFDRDLVLAHSLQRSAGGAATQSGATPRRVVGVVGAAHVRGIRREWSAVPDARSVARLDGTLTPTPEECTLEGARRRHGHDALSWWDQPGIFETAAVSAGAGALALSGLQARRADRTKTHKNGVSLSFASRVSSRVHRAAWFGVAAAVGAGLVGTAATTHAMVELGRFAAKLERAAMAAEASGAVAPKRNELRSERWFETDAFGNTVKRVFVDAVNVATPYRARGSGRGDENAP
jgi:hypothetical protein